MHATVLKSNNHLIAIKRGGIITALSAIKPRTTVGMVRTTVVLAPGSVHMPRAAGRTIQMARAITHISANITIVSCCLAK